MKKNIILAGIALLFVACSNENETIIDDNAVAPVTVHVTGFSVTQEDFPGTRAAQDVVDYSGVNAITLAFYKGSTETEKITQLKADGSTYTSFGEFECSLPMGTYTMVVLAYYNSDASPLELTSPTSASFTGVRAYETFSATQEVVISNTSAVDISATLSRIVTKLIVNSTDGKVADVTNVRMTFSTGGKSFNPTTGLAIVNTGFANTVSNSAAVGATSSSMSFLFLATDEQNIDVTIETLDADGAVLFSKTVNNVPFKRNRVTKLTGAMYTNESLSGAFKVNSDWLDDEEVDF
ncbi:MAG: hypothetical protein J5486_10210 [Bacteroidaceae bacterium]|nr:hypothetical protein [Bacteroidaceae bacterium]